MSEPMPKFDELPEKIREAWIAAADQAFTVGFGVMQELVAVVLGGMKPASARNFLQVLKDVADKNSLRAVEVTR